MTWLKRLPIRYKGELHDVKLINFGVDMSEVVDQVPHGIKIRDFDGRAIISMVNVKLKYMRPAFMPKGLSFDYQHVAFRLLVDDGKFNKGNCQGIYFLQSFTSKPEVVWAGNRMSHYRFVHADVSGEQDFMLEREGQHVSYSLKHRKADVDQALKSMIAAIDQAYAMDGDKCIRTRIQREAWPIEGVACDNFRTNFFKTARFLGAFEVKEVIDYEWLPAIEVV